MIPPVPTYQLSNNPSIVCLTKQNRAKNSYKTNQAQNWTPVVQNVLDSRAAVTVRKA